MVTPPPLCPSAVVQSGGGLPCAPGRGSLWGLPGLNLSAIFYSPLSMLLPSLSLIPSPLPSLYPLPWPPLTSLPSRSPSPIPPMPTQPQIRPRQLIWLPVGAAWSHQAPEKLMPPKICAPADAGACRPAHRNGWGCDPHWLPMAPLTVLFVGEAFRWGIGCGWGRIWCWRALLIAGKLAMLRRTPQHAAAPPTHTPTPPQHSPQLPHPTPTHAC